MEEWDEILNKITQKYKKATRAAITKQVFKEEDFKKENSKKYKDVDDEMNTRDLIIYFFDDRSPSRCKQRFFIYQVP